ncbi:MAG TPA: hypothetical protein VEK08_19285 [Planctomycetota bacterium]|nr:hypothetical protein [Planctomycetota bacterium]
MRKLEIKIEPGSALAALLCFFCALPLISLRAGEAAVAEATSAAAERLHTEARRILLSFKASEYKHKTSVDEESGRYEVDCSGLVCVILKKVAPNALKDISKKFGKARPLAADFYEAFASTGAKQDDCWQPVEKLLDAMPGDLIAWRRAEIVPGEDTGHIVVVDEKPVREDDGSIRVRLIDSTRSGHGGDSRKEGASGVGRGTMWFTVDAGGKPTGYRWRSRTGRLHESQIAIGRILDQRR